MNAILLLAMMPLTPSGEQQTPPVAISDRVAVLEQKMAVVEDGVRQVKQDVKSTADGIGRIERLLTEKKADTTPPQVVKVKTTDELLESINSNLEKLVQQRQPVVTLGVVTPTPFVQSPPVRYTTQTTPAPAVGTPLPPVAAPGYSPAGMPPVTYTLAPAAYSSSGISSTGGCVNGGCSTAGWQMTQFGPLRRSR